MRPPLTRLLLTALAVLLLFATGEAEAKKKKSRARAVAAGSTAKAKLEGGLGSALREGSDVFLLAIPGAGDGFARLAQRYAEEGGEAVAGIKSANPEIRTPQKGRGVKIPLRLLKPELRRAVLDALFPADVTDESGRMHRIGSESTLSDLAGALADWFTGHPSNRGRLEPQAKKKKKGAHELKRGDRVLVPNAILDEALRVEGNGDDDEGDEDTPPPQKESIVELPPAPPPAPPRLLPPASTPVIGPSPTSTAAPAPTGAEEEEAPLEFDVDDRGLHAIYRLRAGEALYSSVVVRFTGRIHASDVNELAGLIACRSDIENVHEIPIGYPVRIPIEWLTPEWLPAGDVRRMRWERSLAEAARFRSTTRAAALEGVHVVLDAGHGGRDVGTSHAGAWESTYVYDIYCRVKRILEERTRATVWPTVEDSERGFRIVEKDRLAGSKRAKLLTDPPYELSDIVAGVHLRWYLANSRYRKVRREGASPDQVVFLSLHADSLHPSLRGAMVYVPGERFLPKGFGKKGEVYESRAEWRDEPVVGFTPLERFQSEGYSRDFAAHILDGFRSKELAVHPWDPIRANVIRKRKEWVPAVLKFNRVPARLLLEVCNMGNPEDRALLVTQEWRQKVAEAIVEGLLSYYDARSSGGGAEARRGGLPDFPARPVE